MKISSVAFIIYISPGGAVVDAKCLNRFAPCRARRVRIPLGAPQFNNMKRQLPASVDEIREACKHSVSISGTLKYLGLAPFGGNYVRIKRIIEENNIDVSHFAGKGWAKGRTDLEYNNNPNKFPNDEVFIKGTKYKGSTCNIKKRLIKLRHNQNHCDCCNLSEWQGKPIILELHHINGDRLDNRLENLQLLCPNCHSMTHNWRRRKS